MKKNVGNRKEYDEEESGQQGRKEDEETANILLQINSFYKTQIIESVVKRKEPVSYIFT